MKHLGNLKYPDGSKKRKKRIGRGAGSGFGGTSTRGHKGQKSRKSYHHFSGFEGGQMPLNRRLPKFGFNNIFRHEYQVVNVGLLQKLYEEKKISNDVDFTTLYELGILSKRNLPFKVLGQGEISVSLKITADSFSESAKDKIETAGGKALING